MPRGTRNTISKAESKVSVASNLRHHQHRDRRKQKASTRSVYRKTNKCTTSNDTLYSITFPDKCKADIDIFNTRSYEKLFCSEEKVIKSCRDIAKQCHDELLDCPVPERITYGSVFETIIEHIKSKYPQYNLKVEHHPKKNIVQLSLNLYFDFDCLHWIGFDELWKICEGNKKYQSLMMNAMKKLHNQGVDICFSSYVEECYIEMLQESISNWDDEFNQEEKHTETEIKEHELSQSQHRDEVAFYLAGEFAQLSKLYLSAHDVWAYNIHKMKPKSDNHKKLIEWFKMIDTLKDDWHLNNHIDDDMCNDGSASIERVVKVFYTMNQNEYMYGCMDDTDQFVQQAGLEQLCFRNIITKEKKVPIIPDEFFQLLKAIELNPTINDEQSH